MTHELVGQRINLNKTPQSIKMGDNKTYDYVKYELNDPVMESKIRSLFSDVRIFVPGTTGTADFKPYRTNVYINEDGLIFEVSNG